MAKGNSKTANGSTLDFEAQLWAADSLRADLPPDLKADFVPVRKDLTNPLLYRLPCKMATGIIPTIPLYGA
jgi:hypothetical protein